MKCENCGGSINKNWSYCAYCGVRLQQTKGWEDIFKIIYNELNNVMNTGRTAEFNISLPKTKKQKPVDNNLEKKFSNVKKVLEPSFQEQKSDGKRVIKMRLPGIKKHNIEIKRMGESIEVKAVIDKKGYFRLIPLKGGNVLDSYLSNDYLVIELTG